MTHYKIIVNPVAGRGAGEHAIPLIEQTLRDYLDFDLVRTGRPWHAAELAQQACTDGYDVVVAGGGDGTANEVLNGLMLAKQSGAPVAVMGVLCVGRGNDFAFGVGVPRGIADGCRVLAQGRRRVIDVGRVTGGLYPQGRYFGNGMGIGFDAVVGFVAAKMKRLTGFPSYIVAALKTIFLYYRAPVLCVEYDDGTLTLPALMVSVMNGRRMGGGFMMGPHARPDDGLFDLCVAQQVSRARISVADTGSGIAPEHHQEIFEDFVRVDRNTSGMGLGLAIAKRLVQAHRGKIWVDSELQAGSCFTFLLPTEPAE